ncbi:hypothetical protein JCM21900_004305 [Sporobolomyces salmonicolor]
MSRAPPPSGAAAFDGQAASASLKSGKRRPIPSALSFLLPPRPPSPPPLTLVRSCLAAFQAELDAVHRAAPAADRPEIYKPPHEAPGAWGSAAAWGAPPKSGAMADGEDFLRALGASRDQLAASAAKGSKT